MIRSLEEVFERKSVFNKLQLKRKLLNLKCTKESKLQDHYLKFENILDEIESIGETMAETDKVCHLLLTLPNEYENVITSIETMSSEKEITLDFVKARLLDAELKIKNPNDNITNNETSFNAENLNCYKCGKRGHKYNQCRQNTMRGRSSARRPFFGYRGRNRGGGTANAAETIETNDCMPMSFTDYTAETNMTDDSNEIKFVVDSGATDNMIQERYSEFMTKIENLDEPIKIKVANGQYLVAKEKGKLKTKYRHIEIDIEALIVPGLVQNLLSVNKLLEKEHTVIFKDKIITIAKNNKRVYGEKCGKLYVLRL